MVAGAHDLTGVLLDGRYRVGELLAVGGMSRVYRGVDTRLDRAVAVKVMDGRLASDEAFRGRLEREARAMARIEHPCVVDVHDHGEQYTGHGDPSPVVYLVMELVTGATLRDLLLERGALTVPEAFAVLEPVLGALAAAHRQGLTHRDVKPENVLISHTGAVKVADFGLVTAAAAGAATRSGVIMGTPAYLSPEQVVGEGIGPRTDVYAAGVLLFELLTGEPPFTGELALSVAYQHVNNDVPPPSMLVPSIPPELDGLVARATRRAAEDRPPDAETLLFAVRGVRAALGIPSVRVPIPTKAGGLPPDGDHRATPDLSGPRHAVRRETRALTSMWPAEPAVTDLPPFDDGPRHGRDGDHGAAYPGAAHRGAAYEGAGYDGDGYNGDGYEDDLAGPPGPGRRWLLAGIGSVLILGVLAAVAGWFIGGGSGVVTPQVVGLDERVAQRTLSDAGLTPVVTEKHNDQVPVGTVAAADPVAGTTVGKGSRVTLTVSTGHPRVPTIPVGTPVGTAASLLSDADLMANPDTSTRRAHPTAPVGTVIATVPAPGTAMTIGAKVTLVTSKGPARNRDRDESDGGGDNGFGGAIDDIIRRQLGHLFGGGDN
ncbi:MAG TPA: protein kinase [Pseudonocardia sp.]|nr:protein kinase [Pseudonocardia sp.]